MSPTTNPTQDEQLARLFEAINAARDAADRANLRCSTLWAARAAHALIAQFPSAGYAWLETNHDSSDGPRVVVLRVVDIDKATILYDRTENLTGDRITFVDQVDSLTLAFTEADGWTPSFFEASALTPEDRPLLEKTEPYSGSDFATFVFDLHGLIGDAERELAASDAHARFAELMKLADYLNSPGVVQIEARKGEIDPWELVQNIAEAWRAVAPGLRTS